MCGQCDEQNRNEEAELKANLAELEEFSKATYAAYCDLFITWEERQTAIKKFKEEKGLVGW